MASFNARQFEKTTAFTCNNCAKVTTYKIASKGCPACGHHLFKVARTGNFPLDRDMDRQLKDPYLRQKQKPIGNDGAGYMKNKPLDEEGFSGFGQRFRGGPGPDNYSQTDSEYDQQKQNNLPSEDTNLDHAPYEGTANLGWFADPSSPLSSTQQMNRDMNHTEGKSLGKMLDMQRTKRDDNSYRRKLDDSIFGRTVSRLRGVKR
jgi:hypothetical protein